MDKIVTKEWLATRLADPSQRARVIGRALRAIYTRQTEQEQSGARTINANGVGFSKPDARVGSIGARQFASSETLQPWVVEVWMRPAKDGMPRICKYADQLNDIANEKLARTSSLAIS